MRVSATFAAAALLVSAVSSATAAPAANLGVVAQLPGPDGGWDFSAFDPVKDRVYVARTDGVTAVDVKSGQVRTLLKANRTHAAIPVNAGAEVLVTEGAAGRALIADAATGAVRATIPTGSKPDAAMVEPATGLALVFDNAGGGIALIDTHAGKAVGSIATPGALESPAADGTGRVFINIEDLAEIVVVDVKARSVLAHWKLDGCESPSGLAYVPKTRLLVSACANKTAKVVSADTGKVVASLDIGGRPDWAGYDPTTGLVLIPTGEDGVINAVAVGSGPDARVAAKTPAHQGSRSGALDPRSGRLYLPSADFVAAAGGRPAAAPGSFKVLVLAH
jgi:DNA-binding beta-propeller fold protein YncE